MIVELNTAEVLQACKEWLERRNIKVGKYNIVGRGGNGSNYAVHEMSIRFESEIIKVAEGPYR